MFPEGKQREEMEAAARRCHLGVWRTLALNRTTFAYPEWVRRRHAPEKYTEPLGFF